MKEFHFEWYRTNQSKLTNYQRLVFHYLIGNLTCESVIDERKMITIEANENGTVLIRCYGVHVGLIKEYMDKFPFKQDTNVVGFEGSAYSGVLIQPYTIGKRPVTISEFFVSK